MPMYNQYNARAVIKSDWMLLYPSRAKTRKYGLTMRAIEATMATFRLNASRARR